METAATDEAAVKLDDCLSCCVETCIDSLLEAKRASSCGHLRRSQSETDNETDADCRTAGNEAAATEDAGKRMARIGANLSWLMEQKRELSDSGADLLRQLRACSRIAGQIRAIQTAAGATTAEPQPQLEVENLRQQPLKQQQPPPPPPPKQRLRNLQSQPPPEQLHWLRHRQQLPQPMQHRHYQPPKPHQTQHQHVRVLQPPSRLVGGLLSQLGAGSQQQLLQSSSTRGPSPKQQQQPQPHPRRRHRTESAVVVSDGSGNRRLSRSTHQTVAVNGSSVDLQWRRSQQGAAAALSDGQQQPRVQLFVRFSGGPSGHQAGPVGEVRRSFGSINSGRAIRTIV